MSIDVDGPVPDDTERMLRDFVRERDVPCPVCGYNVRDLVEPRCPECRQALELRVGAVERDVVWLIVALAPMVFSGFAALILLVPIIMVPAKGGGPPPWFIYVLDAFGWTSGIAGLVFVVRRRRFLRLENRVQHRAVRVVWAVHLVVLAWLLWLMIR